MKLIEIQQISQDELKEIDASVRSLGIGKPNYNIHPDTGIVDVYQSVVIENQGFTRLPIKFGVLAGCFTIKLCPNLTTLEGCPPIVDHAFNCVSNSKLISATGAPQIIKNEANFKSCPITSFEGFPKEIIGNLIIKDLAINTFSGVNKHIKSITGSIDVGSHIYMYHKGMMGLMLIRNLKSIKSDPLSNFIPQHEAIQIINKHLRGDRSGPDCQLELLDAGFEEYAKL